MGTALVAAAALTLSPPTHLARAVAKNEALYHSFDVSYHSHYRLADRRVGAGWGVPGGDLVLTEERAVRHTTFLFWLAPRKNFLPLRVKKFAGVYSQVLPVEVVAAGDLREVRPGVWVPLRVTKTVYDELELRDNQRAVVSNTTNTAVTRMGSAADFGGTFFQELRADGE